VSHLGHTYVPVAEVVTVVAEVVAVVALMAC
jgi:hypothetical protein